MLSYCLTCKKKNTKNINLVVSNTSNLKTRISKCAICGAKKSKLIKKQEANGILSSLGFETP